MADESTNSLSENEAQDIPQERPYAEFEVGEHQVPWFWWLFFVLLICWASISWMPLVGNGPGY